jgi:diguanylate cyclase (GGDEF)-like protein
MKKAMVHGLDDVPIAAFTYDRDLLISGCNARLLDALAGARETLLGLDLQAIGRPDMPALMYALEGEEAAFAGFVTWSEGDESTWVSEHIAPLRDADGAIVGGIVALPIVGAAGEATEQAVHLATHDPLTGLPNRHLLNDRLQMAMAQADRAGSAVSIVVIDIAKTKEVSGAFGLASSEELRRLVAEHLLLFVRKADTLACLGEDFFAIVMPSAAGVEQILALTERIMKVFDGPWEIEEHTLFLTPGVGVATYPDDGTDSETLLAQAVGVAWRASQEDVCVPRLFNPRRHAAVRERLALEVKLRSAVEHEEFLLFYQPQVEAHSGRISGLEALMRWQPPEGELISPGEFIPLAEQTGLIVPLGAWAIEMSCAQLATWQAAGLPPARVAVNLAAPQLAGDELPALVSEALATHGLQGGDLELEITERVALADEELTARVLGQLKDLGVRITLDDFGTGYSSATLLTVLPFDTLKVDRSFIINIVTAPKERAITAAVIKLAHDLGLTVVVEGVETQEQLDLVRALGADEIQGYFYSPPVTAHDCEVMLRERPFLADPGGDR